MHVRERLVERRCGSRLASRCSSCSALYSGDARRLIQSGATGPTLSWMTLTAPGAAAFGAVHTGPDSRGRRRRCKCGSYHSRETKRIGTPVDPDTYDYEKAARFNSHVSRLFTVLVQKLRRLTGEALQLVRVIEFQRRGLAHVHALVRGEVSPDILRLAVRGGINPHTGRRVSGTTSGGFSFGPQCDVRNVEDAGRVGAYMRKLLTYAVKATGDDLTGQSFHAHAMEAAASLTVDCELNCGERGAACRIHRSARRGWGFRGHVLATTKSWGLTFAAIRAARQSHAAAHIASLWRLRFQAVLTPGQVDETRRRLAAGF